MNKLPFICPNCGSETHGKTETPGSFGVELLLWLFFAIPGLLYSCWRISARKKVCGVCRNPGLIPSGSPAAVALRRRLQ